MAIFATSVRGSAMELRGTSLHEVPVSSGYHGGQLFCQPFQVDAEGQSIEVP